MSDSLQMERDQLIMTLRSGTWWRRVLGLGLVIIIITYSAYSLSRHNSQISDLGRSVFSSVQAQGPLAPNTAIYLWCEDKQFEFKNYLSMLSVQWYFRPYKIIFYYKQPPKPDKWRYNTWFEDLRKELGDILQLEKLSSSVCSSLVNQKEFVMKALIGSGGMYVGHSTMITAVVRVLLANIANGQIPMQAEMLMNLNEEMQGFVFVPKSMQKRTGNKGLGSVPVRYFKTAVVHCASVANIVNHVAINSETYCVMLDNTISLYPKDIMALDTIFGAFTREVMYHQMDEVQPLVSYTNLIPKISHTKWANNYLFYLSVLSQIFVLKVDKVYVYSTTMPSGKYWNKLSQYSQVQYMEYEDIDYLFLMMEVLMNKGGIYVPSNALFVRSVDKLLAYDTVASLDHVTKNKGTFPQYFNFGVWLSKKGALFWNRLSDQLQLQQPHPAYLSKTLIYKVWEKYPSLIYIYPQLQARYSLTSSLKTSNNATSINESDWLENEHALLISYPIPQTLVSEDAMKNADNSYAKIGKFILEKSTTNARNKSVNNIPPLSGKSYNFTKFKTPF